MNKIDVLNIFLDTLQKNPENVRFSDCLKTIDEYYQYTPSKFLNGTVKNEAGKNEGSCKIFAFAKLQGLTKEQTLACFGDYYRIEVLSNPDGKDHQNIRQFMISGWSGIEFMQNPLSPR